MRNVTYKKAKYGWDLMRALLIKESAKDEIFYKDTITKLTDSNHKLACDLIVLQRILLTLERLRQFRKVNYRDLWGIPP